MEHRKIGLLLLIPAIALLASSRRAAMAERFGAEGGPHGHHRGGRPSFGMGGWHSAGESGEFRLPPMVASMLDAWHRNAHASGPADLEV